MPNIIDSISTAVHNAIYGEPATTAQQTAATQQAAPAQQTAPTQQAYTAQQVPSLPQPAATVQAMPAPQTAATPQIAQMQQASQSPQPEAQPPAQASQAQEMALMIQQAVAAAVQPLQSEIVQLREQRETDAKASLASKIATTLEASVRSGKIRIADLPKYKQLCESDYDAAVAVLETIQENAIIAKSNLGSAEGGKSNQAVNTAGAVVIDPAAAKASAIERAKIEIKEYQPASALPA